MLAIKDLKEKTFVLIEDIDGLFNKRESTSDNTSVTFSNLINILHGVLCKSGSIIFLTTNHPEKLDQALMRTGRIDAILKLNYPSKKDVEKLFHDIMENRLEDIKTNFISFYEHIKIKKLSMSSIVGFLFRYREKWDDNS